MKLAPPYLEVGEGESHASIDMCGCEDAEQEHSYLALVGGRHCASYEVRAIDITDLSGGPKKCHELAHSSSNGETAAQSWATEMSPHHFEYGSCREGEWVDYSLKLRAEDAHYNYLIEVEDLSAAGGVSNNQEALSLHLYTKGYIPDDRQTDYSHDLAYEGIYSIAINLHNFHEGTSYFSVQCKPYVSMRRFRVVVYAVESQLQLGHEYHGEVCPGEWVYHSYRVPEDSHGLTSLTFHVVKHTGDLEMVVRHDVVPVKLVPPFTHVALETTEADVQVCNSKPGELVYLGMLGGHSCASYEIEGKIIEDGSPCAEPVGVPVLDASLLADGVISEPSKFARGSCEPHAWFDWYFRVTEQMLAVADNLVFEVEAGCGDDAEDLFNGAISLHLVRPPASPDGSHAALPLAPPPLMRSPKGP